jgi:hypothetical protein
LAALTAPKSTVICATIFDVATPPFSGILNGRFHEGFLYGLPNVGYYNPKAGTVGSCPVHNPHYDFNDAALPIGASLFARLVKKKLPRVSTISN